MNRVFLITALVGLMILLNSNLVYSNPTSATESTITAETQQNIQLLIPKIDKEIHSAVGKPAYWAVIPFILLLLMIATGPLFYEKFWHHFYPYISIFLALGVILLYLFYLQNISQPVHSAFEYIQFIAFLFSLYVASGGIWIKVERKATPLTNVLLLVIGAIISNVIGTTGASMLLIRPFIRINENRIKPYHIIFFIFIVSNIGGSLTPIGDPPLFLGFLKGVSFNWTLNHNFIPWALSITLLCQLFYFIDKKKANKKPILNQTTYSGKIYLEGNRNFLWLGIIIIAVFIDPNIYDWVPAIHYHGQKFSFLRELLMLTVAFFAYHFANKKALKENEFSFGPIKEVAFIFIGIFGTMMPALEIMGDFAKSEAGIALITPNTLYWGTGLLSGFLDNAPTYMNFLTAGMASQGASIHNLADVRAFAAGGTFFNSILFLKSVSIGAVFFGAMTYIGNGPNFMVKSISESCGLKMPSFFGYLIKYSLPILLPLFILVWLIFFVFQVL